LEGPLHGAENVPEDGDDVAGAAGAAHDGGILLPEAGEAGGFWGGCRGRRRPDADIGSANLHPR
jgi:hypothetical protein